MTAKFTICVSIQELQNDLEAEQVKVNSLTHMVVVVDENSGESATAALEEQLQVSCQPDSSEFVLLLSCVSSRMRVFLHYIQYIMSVFCMC